MKIVTSVFIFLLLATGYFLYGLMSPRSIDPSNCRFVVQKDATEKNVAEELQEKNIFRSALDFQGLSFLVGGGKIKEGVYYFVDGMSEYEIYRALVSGPIRKERKITSIEGWTVSQIAEYLKTEEIEAGNDFLREAKKDWRESYSFLASMPVNASLEGYLFPDTYRIYEDSSAKDIIGKMLANFDEKFTPQMRQDALGSGLSFHETVTLASIIEREVTSDEDRALVSDILQRRVRIGMPLQADSTVNYLTGKKSPQASFTDIAIDSPYNTYRHRGFPPGPIGNPGLASLKAALYPKSNSYLYFLTDAKGKVYYSKTFEEHKKNKATYL